MRERDEQTQIEMSFEGRMNLLTVTNVKDYYVWIERLIFT